MLSDVKTVMDDACELEIMQQRLLTHLFQAMNKKIENFYMAIMLDISRIVLSHL